MILKLSCKSGLLHLQSIHPCANVNSQIHIESSDTGIHLEVAYRYSFFTVSDSLTCPDMSESISKHRGLKMTP